MILKKIGGKWVLKNNDFKKNWWKLGSGFSAPTYQKAEYLQVSPHSMRYKKTRILYPRHSWYIAFSCLLYQNP